MAIKEEHSKRILYKLNKNGNIQQYVVVVYSYDDGAILETSYGLIGGAVQVDRKPIYPKNIGRANETTPVGQAELEADSKINKLRDKSYVELNKEVNSLDELRTYLKSMVGRDSLGRYLPMLASKDLGKAEWPGYIQLKCDGVRCLVEDTAGVRCSIVNNGVAVTARSRKGKLFSLDHITNLFSDILPPGYIIDGEMYIPGLSLQTVVSMVKNGAHPRHDSIEYRCYDIFGDKVNHLPYRKRKIILARFLRKIDSHLVHRLPTKYVKNLDEAMAIFYEFRAQGEEGAIYRNPNAIYEPGTRSKGLIKIKDFLEEEFELVDMEEATGRDIGTAIMVLKTSDGLLFNSRPLGTREQRRYYLKHKGEFIGKMGTVRFQHWTDEGKPAQSRFIVFRDYE